MYSQDDEIVVDVGRDGLSDEMSGACQSHLDKRRGCGIPGAQYWGRALQNAQCFLPVTLEKTVVPCGAQYHISGFR